METITDKLVLTSVLTEIRFSPSPLFSDLKLLTGYINFLSSRFDSVRYEEQSKQIICNTADGKKLVNVSSTRLVVEFGDPSNYDEFISVSESIITKYTSLFEVNQFDRAGIRYHMPAKFNNFEEANKLFFDKFLHALRNVQIPEDLSNGLNSGKVELYYTVQDRKLNISILPIKMQFLEIKIGPIGQEDTIQNTIEGLLFDMDYFHEGRVTLPQFIGQLKSGIGIVKAKATTLLKALGV